MPIMTEQLRPTILWVDQLPERSWKGILVDADGNCSNCLEWWKINHRIYPHVVKVARKLLCICATSAPVERVFSLAGITIANGRAGMLPRTANNLMLLRSAVMLGLIR